MESRLLAKRAQHKIAKRLTMVDQVTLWLVGHPETNQLTRELNNSISIISNGTALFSLTGHT